MVALQELILAVGGPSMGRLVDTNQLAGCTSEDESLRCRNCLSGNGYNCWGINYLDWWC